MQVTIFASPKALLLKGNIPVRGSLAGQQFDSTDVALLSEDLINTHTLLPLFDRFFLVLSNDSEEERAEVYSAFFSWLAPQYENIIELERNRDNVRILSGLLNLDIPGTVLDFGCGTGFTFRELRKFGHEVIGVDSCQKMREIASLHCREVYSPDEVRCAEFAVDGIIASYVFHFNPSYSTITPCWSRLKRFGILAANVHKGIGLIDTMKKLKDLGAEVIDLGTRVGAERHGNYIIARKL